MRTAKTFHSISEIQLDGSNPENRELLSTCKKRIHPGWYSVRYRGICLEPGSILSVKYNPKGEIQYK